MEVSTNSVSLIDRVTDQLLVIGTLLLASGAHNARIIRNMSRIAETWGYDIQVSSSFTGLLVSVKDRVNPENQRTRFKRCPTNVIRFDILTEISLLSWKVYEEKLSVEVVEQEVDRIRTMAGYPVYSVTLGVGLACACLSMAAGGNYIDGLFAFFASTSGLLVRMWFAKRNFNIFIAVMCGSFVTSMLASINMIYVLGASPEKTLACSVLYLVPGVPLINSVIDWIEGYIPTSIGRVVFSGLSLLAIALGMTLCIVILGLDKF